MLVLESSHEELHHTEACREWSIMGKELAYRAGSERQPGTKAPRLPPHSYSQNLTSPDYETASESNLKTHPYQEP